MMRSALSLLLAFSAVSASAQEAAQRLVFVGCPILRNTDPIPCWMGDYAGELYYLGPQGDLTADFYPPQFNHKMLVEGTVANAPRFCGGIVLKDVKVSVLPDLDPTCNITLPAQGYAERDDIRGSGPSGVRGTPPEPPRPRPAAPPPPPPPYGAKDFVATFDADTDRMWRQAQTAVTEAASYANLSHARTVEVTGYRAAIRLSDGKDFVERDVVAEERAKTVAEGLRTIGLPAATKITVNWEAKPTPASGTPKDATDRRVVIAVKP